MQVEVDAESAGVAIQGYWIAHDSGRLINPMVVEGQLLGAVALGLGGALLEEVVHDDAGQVLTGTLMDYLVPTSMDVPPVHMNHLKTPSPLDPWG